MVGCERIPAPPARAAVFADCRLLAGAPDAGLTRAVAEPFGKDLR